MYFLDYFSVQQQSKFDVTVYQYLLVWCFVFVMIKIFYNLFTYNPLDKDHKNFWLETGITRVMHVILKLINHKTGTHCFL